MRSFYATELVPWLKPKFFIYLSSPYLYLFEPYRSTVQCRFVASMASHLEWIISILIEMRAISLLILRWVFSRPFYFATSLHHFFMDELFSESCLRCVFFMSQHSTFCIFFVFFSVVNWNQKVDYAHQCGAPRLLFNNWQFYVVAQNGQFI